MKMIFDKLIGVLIPLKWVLITGLVVAGVLGILSIIGIVLIKIGLFIIVYKAFCRLIEHIERRRGISAELNQSKQVKPKINPLSILSMFMAPKESSEPNGKP